MDLGELRAVKDADRIAFYTFAYQFEDTPHVLGVLKTIIQRVHLSILFTWVRIKFGLSERMLMAYAECESILSTLEGLATPSTGARRAFADPTYFPL